VDAVADRIDVNSIAQRIDLDALAMHTDIGAMIARSSGGVASGALDVVRSQAVGLDEWIARWVPGCSAAGTPCSGRISRAGCPGSWPMWWTWGPARACSCWPVRTLAFPLSFLLCGLGFTGIFLQRNRRALHDLIAGTAVVYAWHARTARLRFLERDPPRELG
jgi:hypothetical protein